VLDGWREDLLFATASRPAMGHGTYPTAYPGTVSLGVKRQESEDAEPCMHGVLSPLHLHNFLAWALTQRGSLAILRLDII